MTHKLKMIFKIILAVILLDFICKLIKGRKEQQSEQTDPRFNDNLYTEGEPLPSQSDVIERRYIT